MRKSRFNEAPTVQNKGDPVKIRHAGRPPSPPNFASCSALMAC